MTLAFNNFLLRSFFKICKFISFSKYSTMCITVFINRKKPVKSK